MWSADWTLCMGPVATCPFKLRLYFRPGAASTRGKIQVVSTQRHYFTRANAFSRTACLQLRQIIAYHSEIDVDIQWEWPNLRALGVVCTPTKIQFLPKVFPTRATRAIYTAGSLVDQPFPLLTARHLRAYHQLKHKERASFMNALNCVPAIKTNE